MLSTLALLGLSAAVVKAHGTVSGIVADGVFYEGYNPAFQYLSTAPTLVAWATPSDLDNGFIAPAAFGTADVICHVGATNGKVAAPVKAGGKVEFQWTPWPVSHKGPMIDYIANCNGPCETVDKTTLQWHKIDAIGLISGSQETNGYWGSDVMIANNNSWTVTIPTTLATGNYVVRHETIALHAAQSANGAQDYPFCFNLAVTGTGGTDTLATGGTLGTALYTETGAGIIYDVYAVPLPAYTIPGPAMYSGAISMAQTLPAAPTATGAGVTGVGGGGGGVIASSTPVGVSPPPVTTSPTTLATSTKPAPVTSTTPASSSGTLPKYSQCGGQGWTGSGACVSGTTCQFSNTYYSQCL